MANPDVIEIACECQHIGESAREMKDTPNAFNLHEIDEDDSETEATAAVERANSSASNNEEEAVASDDESSYIGDSFCSDESCDESDITNVTSRSLNSSRVTDLLRSQNSGKDAVGVDGEPRWQDDEESCRLSDTSSSRPATADRLAKSRRCRRWNMSFTDEEMRRIERENELLLRKIMAQQKPRHRILGERSAVQPRTSSSAINRRKLQKKIEDDNMLLLKRIQQAKSCVFSNTSKMGCRLTFL